MRRWLTLILAAALAAGAQAQINHPYNEVGIYTVEQPEGCETAQIDLPALTPFTCYLVLTNPFNETLSRPVSTVGGFELHLEPPVGVYLLSAFSGHCPENFGDNRGDWYRGCDFPVIDGRTTLIELHFMATTTDPYFIHLQPVVYAPQTVPGEIAFTDFDDNFSAHVMRPISGSFDLPIFAINWDGDLSFCETVPVREEPFGGVKALYR